MNLDEALDIIRQTMDAGDVTSAQSKVIKEGVDQVQQLVKKRKAEEAAEGMTVQELLDLLNPPSWPYEVDEETRWDKVHEVLPWLLAQAWCFYEGMGHHE